MSYLYDQEWQNVLVFPTVIRTLSVIALEPVSCTHHSPIIYNIAYVVYNESHYNLCFYFTFSHLADAFIQSNLQMRTIEAIKTNKEQ